MIVEQYSCLLILLVMQKYLHAVVLFSGLFSALSTSCWLFYIKTTNKCNAKDNRAKTNAWDIYAIIYKAWT